MRANIQQFIVSFDSTYNKHIIIGFVLAGDSGDTPVEEDFHVELGSDVLDKTVRMEFLRDKFYFLHKTQ
jgi:hypothetical protein